MNTQKVVSRFLQLIKVASAALIGYLCFRVYVSLNIDGLGDKDAPKAVDALKLIYNVAKPCVIVFGLVVLGSVITYSKNSRSAKLAIVALTVLVGVSLYVDLDYFFKATDQAFSLLDQGKAIEAMQEDLLPEEQVIVTGTEDPTLMAQFGTIGAIAKAEGDLLVNYTEVLEIPVNGVMAMSALLTIAYFGTLIVLSNNVQADLRKS